MKFKEITTGGGAKGSAVLCGIGSLMDILGTRHGIITLGEIKRAGFEHDRDALKGDFDAAVSHVVPRAKRHGERGAKHVENLVISKREGREKAPVYYEVIIEDEHARRL